MRKITAVLAVLLLSTLSVFSQQKLTGKVTDANGAPLAGISVKIKGTNTGTSTASDGSFTLDGKSDATLEFSGIGFETRSVRASGASTVSLKQDTKSMSEVVVTGVGTATSKRKVAIDVATVSNKDFAKSATASIEQSIMGQIAGAQIQQTSGNANSGFNIILRGINSLGGTQPMILLDGLEVTSLSDIDPNSIDRVEVVKGAAAGMLYGAQGANGVIQVFSKKGQKGKMNISVSQKESWDQVIRLNELVASKHHFVTDAQGYILDNGGVNRIKPNDVGEWPDPVEEVYNTAGNYDRKNDKPYMEPTYDHLSQSFRTALTQSTSINLSGGADKVDYSFTTSYLNQQDVYSNRFKRLNLNLNLGLELFKGFTLRSNTQTFFTDDNLVGSANSRFGMINNLNYVDFTHRDSIGNLVMKPRNENQHNPLSEQEWHKNVGTAVTLMQSINANYKFPRFVTLDYKFGLNKISNQGFDYYLNQTSALQQELPWGSSVDGSIFKSQDKRTLVNSLASVFVNTDFQKDFNLKVPLKTTTQFAYDYRKDQDDYFDATGSGLPAYAPSNINVANTRTASDKQTTFITFGYLVNQSFDYANLFGVNGGLRSDYSSAFGSGTKPATFYRAGGYFRPSELIKSAVLTDWKIRSSYGEAGIQPGAYDRQTTLKVAALGNASTLYNPDLVSNPNLKVQTSKELEVGTDFTLRRNNNSSWLQRTNVSVTYWKRKSEDIIQKADIAVSGGALQIIDNLSTISSNGVDISLDASILNKSDFVWDFSYRMGFAKSKVDKIANGADITRGQFSLKEGGSVGALYGQYVLRNIDQLDPDGDPYIDPANKSFYTYVDGMVVDTRTNAPVLSYTDDTKELGNAYPKFNASFINTFTYKNNLTVSFQFDWFNGNKIYNLTKQWLYRDRISKDFDQSVNVAGKEGAFVNYYNGFYNSVSPVDWFVENGGFIRLRNLSVSYDLAPLFKVKWFKSASLTLSGRNLWTYTKYSGLDPENVIGASDSQGGDLSKDVAGFKGVDYFGVPNTKSYQIGLSLGF